MELGFGSGNYDNERLSLIPTALFRYGLFQDIELRFVEQLAGFDNQTTSEADYGLSDIELGVKIQILKKEGINSVIAFITHLIIPSGSPELTNSNYGTLSKFAISHGINDFLGLGYNLGYNYFGTGNGDITYSLVLGIDITEKFGMYAEIFGQYSDLSELTSNLDGGITYLVKDNIQLDLSIGLGLNQKMNYFAFGFSWNINCLHDGNDHNN
jgi:hypothetical protein